MAQVYGGGLSFVVLLLFVWILILTIKDGAFKKSAKPTSIGEFWSNPKTQLYRKAATLVGFIVLYIFFLPRLGYTISSFFHICVILYFLGARNKLYIIRSATMITMLGFCLFVLFLNVPLPLDPFSQAVRAMVNSIRP